MTSTTEIVLFTPMLALAAVVVVGWVVNEAKNLRQKRGGFRFETTPSMASPMMSNVHQLPLAVDLPELRKAA